MSGAEVAFTVGSGLLAAVLAVAAYFIDKWIKSVDAKLQKHATHLNNIRFEIRGLPKPLDKHEIAMLLANEVSARYSVDAHTLADIQSDVEEIRETLSKRVLPRIEAQEDYHGKIIIVEDLIKSQEKKIKGLYDAVVTLVNRK